MSDPRRQLNTLLRLRYRLDRKVAAALREREVALRELESLRREAFYSRVVSAPARSISQATLDANA